MASRWHQLGELSREYYFQDNNKQIQLAVSVVTQKKIYIYIIKSKKSARRFLKIGKKRNVLREMSTTSKDTPLYYITGKISLHSTQQYPKLIFNIIFLSSSKIAFI